MRGQAMNILIAMIAGVVGGACAAVATFFGTAGACKALRIRDRDGGIGYAGMFAGILAGVAGMVLSIMALAAAGVLIRYRSQDHPIVRRAPHVLNFELQ